MKHLNYKHLHYFWVIAREGSIARASESLDLAPQTLSGQLASLEEAVGGLLFQRKGRNLVLTDLGRTVFSYTNEMFGVAGTLGLLITLTILDSAVMAMPSAVYSLFMFAFGLLLVGYGRKLSSRLRPTQA